MVACRYSIEYILPHPLTFLAISKISSFESSNWTKISRQYTKMSRQYKVNSSESANIFTFSIVSLSVSILTIVSTDKQNLISSIFLLVVNYKVANSYKLSRFIFSSS